MSKKPDAVDNEITNDIDAIIKEEFLTEFKRYHKRFIEKVKSFDKKDDSILYGFYQNIKIDEIKVEIVEIKPITTKKGLGWKTDKEFATNLDKIGNAATHFHERIWSGSFKFKPKFELKTTERNKLKKIRKMDEHISKFASGDDYLIHLKWEIPIVLEEHENEIEIVHEESYAIYNAKSKKIKYDSIAMAIPVKCTTKIGPPKKAGNPRYDFPEITYVYEDDWGNYIGELQLRGNAVVDFVFTIGSKAILDVDINVTCTYVDKYGTRNPDRDDFSIYVTPKNAPNRSKFSINNDEDHISYVKLDTRQRKIRYKPPLFISKTILQEFTRGECHYTENGLECEFEKEYPFTKAYNISTPDKSRSIEVSIADLNTAKMEGEGRYNFYCIVDMNASENSAKLGELSIEIALTYIDKILEKLLGWQTAFEWHKLKLIRIYIRSEILPDPKRYIGNPRTMEVHRVGCFWGFWVFNKVYFEDLITALNSGYDGCYHCLPEHHTR